MFSINEPITCFSRWLDWQDGKTPLYTAAERGEMAVARVLLQYGANSKISSNVSTINTSRFSTFFADASYQSLGHTFYNIGKEITGSSGELEFFLWKKIGRRLFLSLDQCYPSLWHLLWVSKPRGSLACVLCHLTCNWYTRYTSGSRHA